MPVKIVEAAKTPEEQAAQIVVACLEANALGQWLNVIPVVFSGDTLVEVILRLREQRFHVEYRSNVLLAVAGWRNQCGQCFEFNYRGGRDA